MLAQCTPKLALETRTLQEQAQRNRRHAYVQPLFRLAQAPWCGALPTVRGKQLSDRRCPLNPGEQEEAEIPTVRGKQIEYRRCPLDPGEHEEAECEFSNQDRTSSNLPTQRRQSCASRTANAQVRLGSVVEHQHQGTADTAERVSNEPLVEVGGNALLRGDLLQAISSALVVCCSTGFSACTWRRLRTVSKG